MPQPKQEEAIAYARDVFLKLGSGLVAFVLSFAARVIVARALGAEGNGLAALLILIPTMIAALGSLGIDRANGFLVGARRWSVRALLANSLALAALLTLVTGVAYWAALPLIARWTAVGEEHYVTLALAFAIVPLSLVEMYLQGLLWGLDRIAHLSLVSLVRFASQLIFCVLLVVILKQGARGAVVAAMVSPGLCIAAYLFLLRHDIGSPLTCSRGALKDALTFGVQGHLGSVLQFLNYRLDMFMVSFFTGAANLGYYTVAVSLAEVLWYLPDAAGFVLFPKTASAEPGAARRFTPRVARLLLFITALAAVGLFLVSRPAIKILYTEQFLPALRPLWVLLPGVVVLSYSKVIFSDLSGRGKPYYGTLASLLSVALTLGLNPLLIPRWGIIGAALVSSLAYAANAAAAATFYTRETGNLPGQTLWVQKGDIQASINTGRSAVLRLRRLF